jgi:FG-GAP repeat
MDQRIRSSLARCLAVLVAPVLVLEVMAGLAPAAAASPLARGPAGRTLADAAAPAALRAAIRRSLGAAVSFAGYSQTAELTASGAAPDDGFGDSVALSAPGRTALAGAPGRNTDAGAAYVLTGRGRA